VLTPRFFDFLLPVIFFYVLEKRILSLISTKKTDLETTSSAAEARQPWMENLSLENTNEAGGESIFTADALLEVSVTPASGSDFQISLAATATVGEAKNAICAAKGFHEQQQVIFVKDGTDPLKDDQRHALSLGYPKANERAAVVHRMTSEASPLCDQLGSF
jgi:hypothetical protein